MHQHHQLDSSGYNSDRKYICYMTSVAVKTINLIGGQMNQKDQIDKNGEK